MPLTFDIITFHSDPYLAIAPLSFISVSILFKFAMLPDVFILLSPQEEKVHSSEGIDIHIWQHIHQENLILCLSLY